MKKIILVSGDPNSINSEIIYKSWMNISNQIKKKIILISNYRLLSDQFKKLNFKIKLSRIKNISDFQDDKSLKILNVDLNYKDPFNVSKKSASEYVLKSLNLAHNLALNKKTAGMINCPIDKNLLRKKIGVTEYLASKCAITDRSEVMIIKNKKLMVSPITTHLDLKLISNKINKNLIIKKINVINDWYKKKYKKKPNIAITGLNPHNAEFRSNSEENRIIIPAIKTLKNKKIKITGPIAADTIFINDYKIYDVIVGIYHDQILAPFKALFKFDAINLTLGLKYIRVSPDHGVAKNLIMKKKSNYLSLMTCIKYIHKS
jgi:4-hydroxythreonine-4-phosphate dehydrogenase